MSDQPKKDILIDWSAKLIRLGPLDSRGYPRVAPKIRGPVISHSAEPHGGVHARIFSNRREDFEVHIPDRYVQYVQLEQGKTVRVIPPRTASTASLGPTDYSFTECTASREKGSGHLLITSKWTGKLAVVFWRDGGTTLGSFDPVLPRGSRDAMGRF